jgi:uncharacterized protein YgbK (DUF1537 family)
MEAVLRPVFERLKALDPSLVHYKVCSTFDSSPAVGSIGKAIDIGVSVFGGPCVPLVVGAPALGRYVAFGNLFARSGQDSEVFRLDRHPTMSRHPVTPMPEADLRRVLADQTARPVELVDAATLDAGRIPSVSEGVTLFDTVGEHHLPLVGRAVWGMANATRPLFAVGSSGLEYALVAHWRQNGELPPPPEFRAHPVERIVVASGSCSPVTARQIEWATANGFAEVALRPEEWLPSPPDETMVAQTESVIRHSAERRSVLVHTAKGPEDPRRAEVRRSGIADTGRRLGEFLGMVLDRVFWDSDIRRVCVAGGDTSGYVARELGVRSLEFVAPIAPGSPLCRMHAPGRAADGKEICFKGGQVGKADYFGLVRAGQKQT